MYTRLIGAILLIALLAAGIYAYGEYTRSSDTDIPSTGESTAQRYDNAAQGFSISFPSLVSSTSVDYPESYKVDESYEYQALGPGQSIAGVKFTIPGALTEGTNLSRDSYLSVEWLPEGEACDATAFLADGASVESMSDGGVEYSYGSSSDAGAGNRYDETVYALTDIDPCLAVRYFIHYGAIQNYPEGEVREFDRGALVAEFDAIRRTLTLER